MNKIALTSPGGEIAAPSAIPENLKGDFTTSGYAIIQLVINSLFFIITITSLIFILYAGIRWITSGGDVQTVKNARKQLMYALLGLVVAAISFFLVRAIITIFGGEASFWKLS